MGVVFELIHNHFLKIISCIAILYSLRVIYKSYGGYKVFWFRPAECIWKNSHSWDDVFLILTRDPLDIQEGFPRGKSLGSLSDDLLKLGIMVILLCLTSFYAFIPDLISAIHNDFGFLSATELGTSSSSNAGAGVETLFAALIALGGVVYTAISQLRVKVRSENRQKWIDDVREAIAILVDNMPDIPVVFPRHDLILGSSEANLARVKLELLLNPAERDHRTLITFLRVAYRFNEIAPDLEIWRQLATFRIDRNGLDPWILTVGIDERRLRRLNLIVMIMRLSNALLKREWELVKFGR